MDRPEQSLTMESGMTEHHEQHGSRASGAESAAARDDRQRVAGEIADRLRRRGIRLLGDESDEELVQVLEAVERFETIVERKGGDLMVDEPVRGDKPSQPDDAAFVIPARRGSESTASFIERIDEAATRASRAPER
jgi:hypothetical protein